MVPQSRFPSTPYFLVAGLSGGRVEINILLMLFWFVVDVIDHLLVVGLQEGLFDFVRIEWNIGPTLTMLLLFPSDIINNGDLLDPITTIMTLVVDMHVSQVAIFEVRSQVSLGSGIVLCLLQPGLQSTLRQRARSYRHR